MGLLAVLLAALVVTIDAQPTRAVQAPLLKSLFGGSFVRAEVIVQEGESVRDLRVDRGKIRALAPNQLRLVERDDTVVSIPIATTTSVSSGGMTTTFASLKRGMNVTTVRDDSKPALYVVQPANALPKTVDALLFGSEMIRAEVVVLQGAERDIRIDHGQIVALRPRVVRIREADGRVVAFPIARNAAITLDGRKAPWAWLRTGMSATVLREGDGEASILQASAAGGRR